MGAFLGLSVWFALVTVIPGLVTIAVVSGAVVVVVDPWPEGPSISGLADGTLALAAAVTIMLLTQWAGILLEEHLLVPRRWLGHRQRPARRVLGSGIDPFAGGAEQTEWRMDPYAEYAGLYVLLAELRDGDDVHGHLERAVTQFFLSVNAIVAFAAGLVVTAVLAGVQATPQAGARAGAYALALAIALAATWRVAASRFELMGWSLAATRRRRIRDFGAQPVDPPEPDLPQAEGTGRLPDGGR